MDRIGFVGLGRMGRPMASNLQRKGFDLVVYDINRAPCDTLAELGASVADSVGGVAKEASTVFTCLPSHVEVEAVLLGAEGLIAHARPGTTVVEMSTIDPEVTDRCAQGLAAAGMHCVDAPIGRLASHADAGESLFMVGAEEAEFRAIRPMLDAMGTSIHHCGPVGTGIRTKLVNNYLAITLCQINAEALALTRRFGLDLERTLEVLHGTTATNGQLKINYATKVLTGDIAPGFQIDLAHKDLSLVTQAANASRVPMPVAAAARECLSLARARGWGGYDFSALLDALCESAGIEQVRLPAGGGAD